MVTRSEAQRFLRDVVGLPDYNIERVSAESMQRIIELLDASKTRTEVHASYAAEHERAMTEMARELADARLALALEQANRMVAEDRVRSIEFDAGLLRDARAQAPLVITLPDDFMYFWDQNTALEQMLTALGIDVTVREQPNLTEGENE